MHLPLAVNIIIIVGAGTICKYYLQVFSFINYYEKIFCFSIHHYVFLPNCRSAKAAGGG